MRPGAGPGESTAEPNAARGGPGPRLTRRQLAAGGALLAACAAAGGYRVAIGQEFDDHVADVLGMPLATASALISAAESRVGALEWELRRAAFVVATTPPGRWLLPAAQRRSAIHSVIDQLLQTPGEALASIGLRKPAPGLPCAGLLRR
jgi:hypothetical protein